MSDNTTVPWRVGRTYSVHVYADQVPVATFHTSMDAHAAVKAHNAALDRATRHAQGEPLPGATESQTERQPRWVKLIEEWENDPASSEDETGELALMCMAEADVEQDALHAVVGRLDKDVAEWISRAVEAEAEVERLTEALAAAEVVRSTYQRANVRLELQRNEAWATIERVKALTDKWVARADRERTHAPGTCHQWHPLVRQRLEKPLCSTCHQPMDTPGCSTSPESKDAYPHGFHTVSGGVAQDAS